MLTYDVETMDKSATIDRPTKSIDRGSRPSRPLLSKVVLVIGLVLMMGAILGIRGWGPFADKSSSTSAAGATVPTSREFEDTYGIRLSSVDITAAGGMIQIRYQILDGDKAEAMHSDESAAAVIGPDGHVYSDPGMAGHSHVGKVGAAGTSDNLLLANAGGGLRPGMKVTVRIGDLELRGVPVD